MSIQIYGKNPVLEILKSGKTVHKAYLLEGSKHEILSLLREKKIPTEILDKSEFGRRFPSSAQGVVVETDDYKTLTVEELLQGVDIRKNPFLLMLDEIEDPHNLGAIIRSAEAGGVDGIIIPKNRSAKLNATVAKTSAGAIEHVKVAEATNLNRTIEQLKKEGFWIVGTDLEAERDYQDIFIDRPLCLIIGSEGFGIRRLVKEHADLNVKIPMVGKTNSLNASVSAGILIFDILRRKRG